MAFIERFEQSLQKGLDASKELFEKAKDKTKELGEFGVLKYEIRQLENQADRLLAKLGAETYRVFLEKSESVLQKDDEAIKPLLIELEDVKKRIQEKEQQVENLRKK